MSEPLTRRRVLTGMAAMTVAAVVTPALASPAHAASTRPLPLPPLRVPKLDQGVEHSVIVESACCLSMDKIKHQLQAFLRALQLRFERTDSLQQMLLESWSQEAIDAPVGRCSASLGYYQQSGAANDTRLAVIRILMSALLAEYHLFLATY